MCFVSKKKYRALQGELYAALSEIDKLTLSNSLLDVEVKKYKADAETFSSEADVERERNKALADKVKKKLKYIEAVNGEVTTLENVLKRAIEERDHYQSHNELILAQLQKAEATEKQLRSDYATLLRKAYLRDGRKFVKAVKNVDMA